jgi:hypothetical protein
MLNSQLQRFAGFRWVRAGTATALSAAVVGIPTDVIDTTYFTRMTPVRWWEYPVLVVTAVLTGIWFGLHSRPGSAGSGTVLATSLVSAFAVGCPICNKLVVALLGVSGALGIWAPAQPVVAVMSVAALAMAVILRTRRQECTTQRCLGATEVGSAAEVRRAGSW